MTGPDTDRSRLEATDLRTQLLFWSLSLFVVGYYWLPSSRDLGSTPHDFLFYIGFLPLFLLVRPTAVWETVRTSRLMAVALLFVAYLGLTTLWSRPPTELSTAEALLHTIATAAFLCGSFLIVDHERWRRLSLIIVIAAVSIGGLALVAFALGHRYPPGRLHSPIHFEHPNLFAQYLGVALLLSLVHFLRVRRHDATAAKLALAGMAVLATAVGLTGSRTTAVALAVAAVTILLAARDRRAVAITALLLTIVLATGTLFPSIGPRAFFERGDAGRDEIYTELWQRSEGHRFFGMGLASEDDVTFPPGSSDFPDGFRMPHAHSAIFGTFYWGGLVGLTLLLGVITAAFRRAFGVWRTSGDATGLALLVFGTICLLPDGHRLVSQPHLSSWLLLWLPIARIAASPVHSEPTPESKAGGEELTSAAEITIGRALFAAIVILICAQRFFHFDPEIDTPHMWRQCDTAHYIRAFAEEGIDLLHPKVCWMGDHEVVILEFPLPEAVAAVAYRVVDPTHRTARAVFFAFFLGSAFFFYRLLDEIFDPGIAKIATIIYLAMPLSLYYSRAVHIDFSALFFVHGMALFFVQGLRRESLAKMWAGSAFATAAMLIKAPYVLPLAPPLIWLAARERRWSFVVRSLPTLLAPAVAFVVWQAHVHRVNSAAPDWSFIPSYRKMTSSWGWYFGNLQQRMQLDNWLIIAGRIWSEVVGAVGVPAAAIGIALSRFRSSGFLGVWILGATATMLIFFNLFVQHNYYLIPFLAPVAAAIALGLRWLAASLTQRPAAALALTIALLAGLTIEHLVHAERSYYTIRHGFIDAGRAIGKATEPGALVVVCCGGLDSRSPHLLYHAGRSGWSVPDWGLSQETIDGLAGLGAETLAVVDPLTHADGPEHWLGPPKRVIPIPSTGWSVRLFDLGARPSGSLDEDTDP